VTDLTIKCVEHCAQSNEQTDGRANPVMRPSSARTAANREPVIKL